MDSSQTPAGENDGRKKWSREVAPFLTLGIQLAVTIVAFFFLGKWLDEMFKTGPWLMMTGLGVGMAGGLIKFLRTAMSIGKRSDQESGKRTDGH
jgi:F0F1-type ATP synthase assembly protein I